MLWLALNIFCASCWGLRRVHNSETKKALRVNLNYTDKTLNTHTHTHWLSCFQRWKKSCEVISVGWKNLLMVTGSLRVRFCRAPPYLKNKHTGYTLVYNSHYLPFSGHLSCLNHFSCANKKKQQLVLSKCFWFKWRVVFPWVRCTLWFLCDKGKCTDVSCHLYIGAFRHWVVDAVAASVLSISGSRVQYSQHHQLLW